MALSNIPIDSGNYSTLKRIYVWENGDFGGNGLVLVINSNDYRSWNGILSLITNTLRPSCGSVKDLIHLESKKIVRSFDLLEQNGKYVALGAERLKETRDCYRTIQERQDAVQTLALNMQPCSKGCNNNQLCVSGMAKYRRIVLFVLANGKTQEMPCKVFLSESDLQYWDLILDLIARNLDMPAGVQYLYTVYGDAVSDPRNFQNGNIYVAVPKNERFIDLDYIRIFRNLLPMREVDLKRIEMSTDLLPVQINDPVIRQAPNQYNAVAKSKSEGVTHRKYDQTLCAPTDPRQNRYQPQAPIAPVSGRPTVRPTGHQGQGPQRCPVRASQFPGHFEIIISTTVKRDNSPTSVKPEVEVGSSPSIQLLRKSGDSHSSGSSSLKDSQELLTPSLKQANKEIEGETFPNISKEVEVSTDSFDKEKYLGSSAKRVQTFPAGDDNPRRFTKEQIKDLNIELSSIFDEAIRRVDILHGNKASGPSPKASEQSGTPVLATVKVQHFQVELSPETSKQSGLAGPSSKKLKARRATQFELFPKVSKQAKSSVPSKRNVHEPVASTSRKGNEGEYSPKFPKKGKPSVPSKRKAHDPVASTSRKRHEGEFSPKFPKQGKKPSVSPKRKAHETVIPSTSNKCQEKCFPCPLSTAKGSRPAKPSSPLKGKVQPQAKTLPRTCKPPASESSSKGREQGPEHLGC